MIIIELRRFYLKTSTLFSSNSIQINPTLILLSSPPSFQATNDAKRIDPEKEALKKLKAENEITIAESTKARHQMLEKME
jgi:hypothetical protein